MTESAVPEKTAEDAVPRRPAVIFFDCDDCLYKNDWRVANLLTSKIESFCSERLSMRAGHAYELYKKYGTCLRGMQMEKMIDEKVLEEYLEFSHDVPLHEHLSPDPKLREMLLSLDPSVPKWVFTASIKPHATRCLELLGVSDVFQGIVDVRAVDWLTKHDEAAYRSAVRAAGFPETLHPSEILFLDDSASNVRAAKKVGWQTVLVGRHARDTGALIECDHADHAIDTVHELEKIMPHLFVQDASPADS
jgi:putative hydrolase of the HAD superfamily/pyrimidine and pyridine-specific 5'-nucleotidase